MLIPLVIIAIFLLLVNIYVFTKSTITGGYQLSNICRIGRLSFIAPNNLLKSDKLYVYPINDERMKNIDAKDLQCNIWKPKTLHWVTPGKKWNHEKGLMQCFEIIQPPTGKPIILDILMYNGEDVRFLSFNERMKYLKTLCEKVKLDFPEYHVFHGNKNYEKQFTKMGVDSNTQEIIFKDPKQKYFHPKSTLIWVKKNILTLCAKINNGNIEFENRKGSYEKISNNEFPMKFDIKQKDGFAMICDNKIINTNNKITVNTYYDAISIWKFMNKGMTLDSLLGNDINIMKRIHRNMEYPYIFKNIPDNSTILDIGSGRGANIMHWKNKRLNVYAVEPNKENYKILEKKIDIYPHIKTLNTYGQESKKILKFVNGVKINALVMIYSLTFFFESSKVLDNFVQLVDDVLEKGGLFLGTVMDGNKLLKILDKKNTFKCSPFTIKVKKNNKTKIGNKVFIDIDDKTTLVKKQTEYLVDFDALKNKLAKKKIILRESGFVDDGGILNECQEKFTKMMRWFVFEKK